ncbi:MAG: J domain-containing protein, partial [Acidobacteria bacterium]|nr:J domain-containing protein [Acidobacteriota bacterium]
RARQEEPRPHPSAEASVELDFSQAVRGTAVVVAVRREVPCTGCGGSGHVRSRPCARCTGSGVLVETERVRVKIPSGVGDGDRIRARLKGGGEVSVLVQVRPDPFFERRGDDIYTTVPVSFPEAYQGADVEVGTIWGPVRAKVPPGTSSGQRFRLRGKGMRNIRTGVNGDHFYTVLVTVPRVITPAGRDSMRRVTELYGPGYDPRSGMPLSLDGR